MTKMGFLLMEAHFYGNDLICKDIVNQIL